MIQQILQRRYLNKTRLMIFLESVFGRGNFNVKHIEGNYILHIPRRLIKAEIDSIQQYSPKWYPATTLRPLPEEPIEPATHARNTETPIIDQNSKAEPLDDDRNQRTTFDIKELPLVSPTANHLSIPYSASSPKADEAATAHWEISPDLEESAIEGTVSASWDTSHLASGQTSSVYAVNALLIWNKGGILSDFPQPQPVTVKLALKQLHRDTPLEQFLAEFSALKSTREYNHPNIVQVLQAFRLEENGLQTFNLLFPRAMGNFKELFRGSLDHFHLTDRYQELWGQFEGLANALEFLHDKCRTAHRDIKPSNVLLYDDTESGILQARLADFGLALNLEGTMSWNLGTTEAQSAWRYDAPELRRNMATLDTEHNYSPSPIDLLKADIWKLGAVFTELLTFLTLKSHGQSEFRKFITTTVDGMTSDTIDQFRFDDGERVKPEVLKWLARISRRNFKAAELEPLLVSMLGDASGRPDAQTISRNLRETSSCFFTDGARVASFATWDRVRHTCIIDYCKERLESILGSEIDWWPFAQGSRSCARTNMRIFWKWHDRWLTVDAPTNIVQEYKSSICYPVSQPPTYQNQSWSQSAATPGSQSNQVGHIYQPGSTWIPMQQISNQAGQQTSSYGGQAQSSSSQAPRNPQELYWCIDKPFADLRQISVSSIYVGNFHSDEDLFLRLQAVYNHKRGRPSRILSWKNCQSVEFIQFAISRHGDTNVSRVLRGLPHNPPYADYSYTITASDELHMAMVGKEIVTGIHNPRGATTLLTFNGIPKRLKIISMWSRGDYAWGVRAIQGWSLFRVSSWMIVVNVVGIIHIVLWLCFVNPKDLQNAFQPLLYLLTAVFGIVGLPNYLDLV